MSNAGENAGLISSLNAWAPLVDQGLEVPAAGEVMRNAATALIKAETLLEEARRALAPFIRLADNVFSDGKNATVADEVTLWCFNDTDITFGDLRRARATLDRIGK